MEMMRREHFNRWYSLVPYFLSVVTFEIPFQVSSLRNYKAFFTNSRFFQLLCATTYLSVSYWLTGNYQENWRTTYFFMLVSCGGKTSK